MQIKQDAASCARTQLIEERLFGVILTRVTKIADVVFQQERTVEDLGEEPYARNQKVENFAIVRDGEGDGGVYFLVVTSTDACKRQMVADPRRIQTVGPGDQVPSVLCVKDCGTTDGEPDAVKNDGELAGSFVKQGGREGLKLKPVIRSDTVIGPKYWIELVVGAVPSMVK